MTFIQVEALPRNLNQKPAILGRCSDVRTVSTRGSAPDNVRMTAVDQPSASAPQPAPRHSGIGFLVSAALITVSVALFIVSGFAILSSESGVAQPVATILGGAGVLGAGVLTFRSAHNTRLSAEATAAAALDHAQKELEEQQRQAEAARIEQSKSFELTHHREAIRDLRSRYTTTAEQLAADSAAIRLAGVYALASLADDWHDFGNDDERQVCVDLLCAYLRTERPTTSTGEPSHEVAQPSRALAGRRPLRLTPARRAEQVDGQEKNVRSAIIDVIAARSRERNDGTDGPWSGLRFNLTGANLTGANLKGANLPGADLPRADLTLANLTLANLTDATLALANLSRANLSRATLDGALLFYANLTGATLTGATLGLNP